MKKTLSLIIAVAMVLGAALTASAATQVQVTLTSPTITKAVGACEKAGAVTFSFPAGAILSAGDWWYMDLPENATLCKDIDYLIVNADDDFAADQWVAVDSTNPVLVTFNAAALGLSGTIPIDAEGPVTTVDLTGGAATVVAGANMAFRVVGTSGSRRVTLYVVSDAAGVGTITVQPDSALTIKILDGAQNIDTAGAVDGDTRVITDLNKMAFSTASPLTPLASGKYRMFGQSTTDALPVAAASKAKYDEYIGSTGGQVPYVENTLCVSANKATGNLHVSFASKNDKFTFTGDSQIAHTGTANTITLKTCVPAKSSVNDQILIGEQDLCSFDYEQDLGYCPSHVASNVYLESDTVFGDLGDLYDVVFEVKTSGVYFAGHATIGGLLPTETVCDDPEVNITTTNDFCAGTTCNAAGGDVEFVTGTPCTIETKNQVNKIYTTGGLIDGVHIYKYLVFDFDNFVYDKAVVKDGTEVDVQVTLNKYPCGQIFADTVTIGTFVTTCTTASTGSTNLLFPYLIGTKFGGWFSGFVISNGSTKEGTAVLTAIDQNNNKATFTTPSIPAGSHYNCSFLAASDWAQDAANTANFDMTESFTIKVLCNFDDGAGIAFLGNMNEGYAIGYSAESSDW